MKLKKANKKNKKDNKEKNNKEKNNNSLMTDSLGSYCYVIYLIYENVAPI